ncbi:MULTISPECIES: aminotransferase class V-fold PLP-dependent enzyme [Actinomyces]|uniref:cysteine desulfurase n=1 Tax=Actinomyces respiraculi TaxID=2744574 RepID=A0A7T0PX21_9ACTO|nr:MULTISPECIES: aminotransferase class V-fold PLP-dependent enzyme [Actinomyces]QPL06339.1 aminotransferase class V-fold PLP-dependent enzyme [Actinomyces respiraculi]
MSQPSAAKPLTEAEVAAVRADFPYLTRPARGGLELAYLDWGATSQKPACVIEREAEFYRMSNGAAGRSTYQIADEATAAWDDAHEDVAALVGARASQIVFTKNATEAVNLVSLAIAHASAGRPAARGGAGADAGDPARSLILGEGDEVVVSRAEHHANLVPWQELCARTGARLRWLDLTPDGRVDASVEAVSRVVTERTRVIALTHASNVTGALTPLDDVLAAARAVSALVLLDTCQSGAHVPLDFAALSAAGVDAMVLSSHKMLGPTGIGALVATEELLEAMPPVLTGGSMIEAVTMESSTYMSGPARFEAGSQPLAQAAGWSTAVGYLASLGLERLHAGEQLLTQRVLDGLATVTGVRVLGPTDTTDRLGVVAFAVDGVHPHDVGQVLDAAGVAVRTGHHCAQPIHAAFGVHASSRVSFGPTTTPGEIDRFLQAVDSVRSYFGR